MWAFKQGRPLPKSRGNSLLQRGSKILRHLHHLPHGEGGCERADVVGIVVIFLQSRRNTGPRAAGDLDIAVAFVILEQDVVLGRVGLDLAGLEDEGLKL